MGIKPIGGRRASRIAFLILSMAFITMPAIGQDNPFLSRPAQEPGPPEQESPMMDHGPTGSLRSTESLRWGDGAIGQVWAGARTVLVRWQRGLNRNLGLRLRSVAANDRGILGVIGVLGLLFAVMHALSAMLIVMVSMALLEVAIGSTIAQVSRVTQILSSVLLIGIGIVFCYFSAREIRSHTTGNQATDNSDGSSPPHGSRGHCKHHDPEAMSSKPTDLRMRRWVPVVLSTGIIPCPITTALMLFAVSINAVGLGVAAVAALSAGLGLALAILAVITILIKGRIISLLEHKAGHVLHSGVELAAVS